MTKPTVIIVEGGQSKNLWKTGGELPAELYSSEFVRTRIEFCMFRAKNYAQHQKKHKVRCMVFSPKYGLMDADKPCLGDDQMLSSMNTSQCSALINRVAWDFKDFKYLDAVEIHGSPQCVDIIRLALAQFEDDKPPATMWPMKALTLPEQLNVYKEGIDSPEFAFLLDEVELDQVKKIKVVRPRSFYTGAPFDELGPTEQMIIDATQTGVYGNGWQDGDKTVCGLLGWQPSKPNLQQISLLRDYLTYPMGFRQMDEQLIAQYDAANAGEEPEEVSEQPASVEEPTIDETPRPEHQEAPEEVAAEETPPETEPEEPAEVVEEPPARSWQSLNVVEQGIIHGWCNLLYGSQATYKSSDRERNEEGDRAVAEYIKEHDQSGEHKELSHVAVKLTRQQLAEGGNLHNLHPQWIIDCKPAPKRIPFDDLPFLQKVVVYGYKQGNYQPIRGGFDVNTADQEMVMLVITHLRPVMKSHVVAARQKITDDEYNLKDSKWTSECPWSPGDLPWSIKSTKPVKKKPSKKKKPKTPEATNASLPGLVDGSDAHTDEPSPTPPARVVDAPEPSVARASVVTTARPVRTTPRQGDINIEDPLSDEEIAERNLYELDIQEGFDAGERANYALMMVQEKRLYREGGLTFDEYLWVRWSLKRSRGYQLIDFAKISKQLTDEGVEPPKNESVARELKKLPEEERAEVLETVRKEIGGEPTAKEVKEEVKARKEAAQKAREEAEAQAAKDAQPQIDVEDVVPPPKEAPTPKEAPCDRYGAPARYVNVARRILGGSIDLDPASNYMAQSKIVQAKEYFTIKDNGLDQSWHGTVWLYPPESNPMPWVDGLLNSLDARHVEGAVVMVPTKQWELYWTTLANEARHVIFPSELMQMWLDEPTNEQNKEARGYTMFTFGDVVETEVDKLAERGWVVMR